MTLGLKAPIHTHQPITGNTLRMARLIYGFNSQEALGNELGVTLGTIQRYEDMDTVDPKTIGLYKEVLKFDLQGIADAIWKFNFNRELPF